MINLSYTLVNINLSFLSKNFCVVSIVRQSRVTFSRSFSAVLFAASVQSTLARLGHVFLTLQHHFHLSRHFFQPTQDLFVAVDETVN